MSLGYLGAIDVQKIRTLQLSLRALAQNRKWSAADPGNVDGHLDRATANAIFAVMANAPGIPSTVAAATKIVFFVATLQSDFLEKVEDYIDNYAPEIEKAIKALTIIVRLRTPGGAAPAPEASSAGASASAMSKIPISVKVGVPAALALLLVLK